MSQETKGTKETREIKQVSSEFQNVYRIVTDDFTIDVFEEECPKIGQIITYTYTPSECNETYMYGDVYSKTDQYIYISFGGLLGKFKNNCFCLLVKVSQRFFQASL